MKYFPNFKIMNTIQTFVLLLLLSFTGTKGKKGHEDWGTYGNSVILSGYKTAPGQFSHQLAVEYHDYQVCSAALIGPNVALTAAHCVAGKDVEYLTLVAGRRYQNLHDLKEQVRKIDSIDIHEAYNGSTWLTSNDEVNDIALLHVERENPFEFTDHILPIALPQKTNAETKKPSRSMLSGWGVPQSGGLPSNDLQYVVLEPISDEKCQLLHPEMTIRETMLCAQYTPNGNNTCLADSGGPLVSMKDGNLVGIASYEFGCGYPERAVVFTEVAHYVDWILAKKSATETISGCRTIYRPPSRDCRWGTGLDLDTDLTVLGAKIHSYGILWFSRRWSSLYIKGKGDIDWHMTDQSSCNGVQNGLDKPRRLWSYFEDHSHYYKICDDM
ncbi:trypsin-1 [Folsomia candida]|uniref:Trypsin-1 n=1 Tax=Folsomia candida TaxID=158441 RepID=A0A226D6V8_FOLCA|nr:trypsin-1 [Folsomia candida]OXA40939.1 Trypsin-1 [Folsomia candida]